MFSKHNDDEKALHFILNSSIHFDEKTKLQYYAAFRTLEKHPEYFDFLELNSDDPRLLQNRNALSAYCHYILSQLPTNHFRFKFITQFLENHLARDLKLTARIMRGEIVEFPPQELNVPMVDIFDYLKQPKKNLKKEWILSSSGEVIFLADLQATIFANNHTVFHDADTISELVDAMSITTYEELSQLIAYRPETLVLHQALIDVSLRIKMVNVNGKDDKEVMLIKNVNQVIAHAKEDLDKVIKQLYEKRKILHDKISKEVNSNKIIEFKDEIALSQSKIKNNQLGKFVIGFTSKDALIILTLDRLFAKIAERKIQKIINKHIDDLIALKRIFPYDIPEPKNRMLYLAAGGQSSGKSKFATLYIQAHSRVRGGWANIQKLFVDDIRKEILSHSKITQFPQELYLGMTQTQMSLLVFKINHLQKKMVKENGSPHLFIEKLFIDQDTINLGLSGGGNVHIILISNEIEACIKSAFIRGKTTGRYTMLRSMLNAHKESTRNLPDQLLECLHKRVTVEILDNNNFSQGETPRLIARIHCQKGVFEIYDAQAFVRYIHKIALNTKATSLMNLYDNDLEKSATMEKYLEKIKTQYEILYFNENNQDNNLTKRIL